MVGMPQILDSAAAKGLLVTKSRRRGWRVGVGNGSSGGRAFTAVFLLAVLAVVGGVAGADVPVPRPAG